MDQRQVDFLIGVLASYIRDGDMVSTGVASLLPMLAILYAQRTTCPNVQYINCMGAVNPVFDQVSSSSTDIVSMRGQSAFLPLADLFDLGTQGRIDVMFFGGAQIDRQANINLTCIGDLRKPRIKLAGPAGSSLMLSGVKRPVLFTLKHDQRTFVPKVDFITARSLEGREARDIVTNLGILRIREDSATIVHIHPWADKKQILAKTGFALGEDIDPDLDSEPADLDILSQFDPQGIRYELWSE